MKKIIKVAVLLFATVLSGWLILQEAILTKAQTATQVIVVPASTTPLVGTTVNVDINVASVTNLGAYQFSLNFNPAVLQETNVVNGAFLSSTGRTLGTPLTTVDNTLGKVTYALNTNGTTPAGPDGSGTLATVTFNVVGSGLSNLNLSGVELLDATINVNSISATTSNSSLTAAALEPSSTPIVTPSATPDATPGSSPTSTVSPSLSPSPTIEPTPTPSPTPSVEPTASPTPSATPIVSPATSASPTVEPTVTPVASATPLASPSVTPSATPNNGTAQLILNLESKIFVNEEFVVDLSLDTDTPVIGVDAIVLFDPTKLTAVQIDDQHLLPVTPKAEVNNGNGTARISQVMGEPGNTYQGKGILAKITFKSALKGARSLGIDYVAGAKNESNVFTSSGVDILVQPKTLDFEIIDHADLTITVTTPSENGYDVTGTLSDKDSAWNAQITTDKTGTSNTVQVDDGFIGILKNFYFKVSGFLRRQFSLTINSGHNTYDVGTLKAGDLNDDGIVNNADLGIMYASWYGTGAADFNRDGIVNSYDYWLLTQNFLQENE